MPLPVYYVPITQEMYQRALIESEKRDPDIDHHFELDYINKEERDVVGFVGEFACCTLFNIDWQGNIRENYYTIDSGDINIKGRVIDVKTETIPDDLLNRLIAGQISDDRPYGRRPINVNQVPLLKKYDAVIFGACSREEVENFGYPQYWYVLGYASVKKDLAKYMNQITQDTPFGTKYRTEVLPFRTSEIRNIDALRNWAFR